MEGMDSTQIIEFLGGTSAVAKLFRISPGAVSQWKISGIPPARLMFLELYRPELFRKPRRKKAA